MLKGLRLLVVDDNEAARVIVREQLVPLGVEVVEAATGMQALGILEQDNHFDIAILDFMMPHMDGAELAEKMKTNPATKNIALLMMTSAPGRGDKQWMEEIGLVGYLSKPLASWHLRDALAVIAEAQKSGRNISMVTQHNLKEAKAGEQKKANEKLHFNNAHILLAEDNPVNQIVATAMLEKYGLRVTPAGDGDEAVKQLKARNFDLVLMDCQMPVMDGYEATQTIRKLEAHQKRARVPVVALTANAMKSDDEKCIAAGMDDYITKPLCQSDLERILLTWLPKEKQEGNAQKEESLMVGATNYTLDERIFSDFAELMGENLSLILTSHLDVAEGYVKAIQKELSAGDFKAMASAAHPLKSSSQQIGAMKVAEIAKEVEHLAGMEAPDVTRLKTLAEQALQAQEETKLTLAPYLKDKAE
ncbi:MAG: response regulator [Pseudomonadota bacterium]